MLDTSVTTHALPYGNPLQVALSRPPPQPRVVEDSARATLSEYKTSLRFSRPSSALEDLASSARQFAQVLDSTGSVAVAAAISGLSIGQLDVYA